MSEVEKKSKAVTQKEITENEGEWKRERDREVRDMRGRETKRNIECVCVCVIERYEKRERWAGTC